MGVGGAVQDIWQDDCQHGTGSNGIGPDEIGAEFAVRTVAGGIGEVVPGQRGYTRGHCQQFRLVVQPAGRVPRAVSA